MNRSKTKDRPVCVWCHEAPTKDSPYRSPMIGTPGGEWKVCSPACPQRPEGVKVFAYRRNW